MSRDLERFHRLLRAFVQDGYPNLKHQITRMPIIKTAKWVERPEEINKIAQANAGDFGEKIISINPPSRLQDSAIGLWCKWDFDSPCRSKVEVMICRGGDENFHARSYGFRIDPPHFQGDKRHDYWHAQSIKNFERATSINFPSAKKLEWLDDSVPAHPIVFQNPNNISITDTAIYAALSIYGTELPRSVKNVTKSLGLNENFRYILSKVTEAVPPS